MEENIVPVDVRNVQNLSGRYVRFESFYGGTLSLQVADTARNCLRSQKVAVFMKSCKTPIFGLQETRLTFESSEPIVHRKLYIEGIWLHVYLMSAINGYNGMAFISRMQLFVEKVSDRVMKGRFVLEAQKQRCSMFIPPLLLQNKIFRRILIIHCLTLGTSLMQH